MHRHGPVVVGVDGSTAALAAVDWAADRAQHERLPLVIAHAFLWDRFQGEQRSPAERLRKRTMLIDATNRAGRRAPAVQVATELLAEPTVAGLLHAARDASLLVLGSHGRGTLASLLLGSVGSGVASQSRCPVVVMRGRVGVAYSRLPRVVLGVSDRTDRSVVEFALDEAERLGAELLVVQARRPNGPLRTGEGPADTGPTDAGPDAPVRQGAAPRGAASGAAASQSGEPASGAGRSDRGAPVAGTAGEALARASRSHPGIPVERRHVEASARTALLDASYGAELLVVGAERQKGRRGIGLSSLHHAILHRAHCPVAVVPLG